MGGFRIPPRLNRLHGLAVLLQVAHHLVVLVLRDLSTRVPLPENVVGSVSITPTPSPVAA